MLRMTRTRGSLRAGASALAIGGLATAGHAVTSVSSLALSLACRSSRRSTRSCGAAGSDTRLSPAIAGSTAANQTPRSPDTFRGIVCDFPLSIRAEGSKAQTPNYSTWHRYSSPQGLHDSPDGVRADETYSRAVIREDAVCGAERRFTCRTQLFVSDLTRSTSSWRQTLRRGGCLRSTSGAA